MTGMRISVLALALLAFPVLTIQASAQKGGYNPPPPPPPPSGPPGGPYKGAPGPIVGAGLPVLAVGYGVYWLVRRRRKSDNSNS